jgi:hypothetical protein
MAIDVHSLKKRGGRRVRGGGGRQADARLRWWRSPSRLSCGGSTCPPATSASSICSSPIPPPSSAVSAPGTAPSAAAPVSSGRYALSRADLRAAAVAGVRRCCWEVQRGQGRGRGRGRGRKVGTGGGGSGEALQRLLARRNIQAASLGRTWTWRQTPSPQKCR